MSNMRLSLTPQEALALLLLADNTSDDGLEVFFHVNPELVRPAQSALTKLDRLVRGSE